MDLTKYLTGPLPEWERQRQQDMELSSELFRHQMDRDRERARRAKNIADAAEHALMAADNAARSLEREIAAFERQIQPDEEARICVVGGPAGILIFPESIEAIPPDKLIFSGRDQSGALVRAIQHVSQISLLLKAVKAPEGSPPQRTGFHRPHGAGRESG